MSTEYTRGPPCGIDNCRSRHYRVLDDGYTYCRNGHRSAVRVVIGEDETLLASQVGARKVTRRERDAPLRLAKHLTGPAAYELYLQCYQLVLRKQVWWLVHVQALPDELESVVRDLWALLLTTVKERGRGQYDDEVGEDGAGTERLFSSQGAKEEDGAGLIAARVVNVGGRRYEGYLKMTDTLALCYLGCLMLRLPVSAAQFHDWIESQQLLFLKAFQAIPERMSGNLPAELRKQLHQTFIPGKSQLHVLIADVASNFQILFGLDLPPINHALLLFRWITELALPLEVFSMAKKLAAYMPYDFTFPARTQKTPIRLYNLHDLPEASLTACLVIAVKLLYPFDTITRHPRTDTELFARCLDWEEWNRTTQDYMANRPDTAHGLPLADILKLTEEDAFNLTDAQVDGYLDWYEHTWTDAVVSEKMSDADVAFQNDIFTLFPTSRSDSDIKLPPAVPESSEARNAELSAKLKHIQTTLELHRVIPEDSANPQHDHIHRPGSRYACYTSAIALPPIARPFFAAVAEVVGLNVDDLIVLIAATEERLQKQLESETPKIKRPRGRPRKVRDETVQTPELGVMDSRDRKEKAKGKMVRKDSPEQSSGGDGAESKAENGEKTLRRSRSKKSAVSGKRTVKEQSIYDGLDGAQAAEKPPNKTPAEVGGDEDARIGGLDSQEVRIGVSDSKASQDAKAQDASNTAKVPRKRGRPKKAVVSLPKTEPSVSYADIADGQDGRWAKIAMRPQ